MRVGWSTHIYMYLTKQSYVIKDKCKKMYIHVFTLEMETVWKFFYNFCKLELWLYESKPFTNTPDFSVYVVPVSGYPCYPCFVCFNEQIGFIHALYIYKYISFLSGCLRSVWCINKRKNGWTISANIFEATHITHREGLLLVRILL